METFASSRDEALRRALLVAIPVGTQLGSFGLDSFGRAADNTLRLATWSVASAVRTAGASAAFVNRNVLAPLGNFAFGSNASSTNNVHFCTQTCAQLPPHKNRKHNPSRAEMRYQRVASNLRSGSAKCSIRRLTTPTQPHQHVAAAAVLLATHLAASCALRPSSSPSDVIAMQGRDESIQHHLTSYGSASGSFSDEALTAQWTVNALGLQSSML